MTIWELGKETISKVEETSFQSLGVNEREDLQP